MAQPDPTAVSLEQYALVLCATDEGAPLDVALELAAIPAADWPAAEAHNTAQISRAAADPTVLPAFDEAMRSARVTLARPVTPIDSDVAMWGRWLRDWSSAPDPLGMLSGSGMDVADVMRLSAAWSERLKEDRSLVESFAAEMQGKSPAPAVRVEESPRLAAARVAVASRQAAASPQLGRRAPGELVRNAPGGVVRNASILSASGRPSLDTPPRPPLMGALPGELPTEQPWIPAASAIQASSPVLIDAPAPESRAIPSFMAARPSPPLAPAAPDAPARVGSRTAPLPVFTPGVPSIASAPLPFDPTAQPEQMPSQGPQRQSGLTGDVDVSAIVRKILAFGPKKADTPPVQPGPANPAPAPPSPVAPAAAAPARDAAPTLTIEQYASLCVDIELRPAQSAEILRRYGTTEAGRRVLDEGWSRIFAEQPARRTAFDQAKAAYRVWLAQNRR